MTSQHAPLAGEDAVIVIGAGVLGLTTANLLISKYPNKHIVIVAAEFPGDPNPSADYASMWAGAHYRPEVGSTKQLRSELRLGQRTFEVMKAIATKDPGAGVGIMSGVEYLDRPSEEHKGLSEGRPYTGPGDGFRLLRPDELLPGAMWGCEYQSYSLNVPIYCSWLLSKFISSGGRVIKQRLKNASTAFDLASHERLGRVRTVVNCSGRNFDMDPMVRYIRGQTCLVRQQYHRTVTRQHADGTWFALIPRPLNGGTIVGVSKEPGDTETRARNETREIMLRQAVSYFPDFVDQYEKFDIVSDNVGRRPWREGGTRVEVEQLGDGGRRIVHGYGVGGRGYELSWGIGELLLALIEGSAVGEDELPSRL